jgi:hypothetical protein
MVEYNGALYALAAAAADQSALWQFNSANPATNNQWVHLPCWPFGHSEGSVAKKILVTINCAVGYASG